jgi:hypothetical protein
LLTRDPRIGFIKDSIYDLVDRIGVVELEVASDVSASDHSGEPEVRLTN